MGFRERYLTEASAHTGTTASPTTSSTNNSGSQTSSKGPADPMSFIKNEVQKTGKEIQDLGPKQETPSLGGPANQQMEPSTIKGIRDNSVSDHLEQSASQRGVMPTLNDIIQRQESMDSLFSRLGG